MKSAFLQILMVLKAVEIIFGSFHFSKIVSFVQNLVMVALFILRSHANQNLQFCCR